MHKNNNACSRRAFLGTASGFVAAAVFPQYPLRASGWKPNPLIRVGTGRSSDPDLHALAARAVDAALGAGAAYADVRLTLTRHQKPAVREVELRAIGIRALVGNTWGFLSSTVWSTDEVARLATSAVSQAKTLDRGQRRAVDVGHLESHGRGQWIAPIKYDPFEIPVGEKLDVMNAFTDFARNFAIGIDATGMMAFSREHKVFASSEGASWAQTRYLSSADFDVGYRDSYHASLPSGGASADFLSPTGRGWEHVVESGLLDRIPALIDFAEQTRHQTTVDVGRYDVVFSAPAMAALLDQTLGPATELDRAMGYEANTDGVSYLNNPLEMLGNHRVGSSLVTMTANRSMLGGAATVKWDDEGVEAEPFPLIHEGILVDYQTTRESAAWLASYYQRIGKPVRSHGCASAESGLSMTLQHPPNLQLMPGKNAVTFNDLVASTENGIAVYSLTVNMDQQQLNGIAHGVMREIKHGKLGRFIRGGALVIRAPDLWNNMIGLGGPESVQWTGLTRSKGEPPQSTTHSVGAVPAKVKQLSVIDAMRTA